MYGPSELRPTPTVGVHKKADTSNAYRLFYLRKVGILFLISRGNDTFLFMPTRYSDKHKKENLGGVIPRFLRN